MPASPQHTFTLDYLQPCRDPHEARVHHVRLGPSASYSKGQVLGETIGANEMVQLTISGIPTGGTFTLTFGGQTTAALALGASSLLIRQALEALSSIGDGNVGVEAEWAHQGGMILLEFRGALGKQDVGAVSVDHSSLTGGSASSSVTVLQEGAAGTRGAYKAYDADNTDGSEVARCLLKFACTTDADGNITGGTQDHGPGTRQTTEAYFAGTFLTSELVGLDQGAVESLGELVLGSLANGILRVLN